MDKEYLENIEKLNLEIIELKKSKEYVLGRKILRIKKLLKQLKVRDAINEIVISKKIKKYNFKNESQNNYTTRKLKNERKPKIVVYTCITGNYDNILEPFIKVDNVDFVIFTDIKDDKKLKFWNKKVIPSKLKKYSDIKKNRYIKMHPNELFTEYDYSIYIDGNVQVMSDLTDLVYSVNDKTGISMHRHKSRNCIYDEIEVCRLRKKGNYKEMKKQVAKYKEEGFPCNFGMLEATIIVTDLKNLKAKKIYEDWWNEFNLTLSLRDQISLHYIIWKNNLTINDFGCLGYNLYRNPKFRICTHKEFD